MVTASAAMVTAAAPLGQIQNCNRLNAVEKADSALHRNIAEKGGSGYYHAHSREYEIPANAKIITGPGLVAGGPPQRLSGPDGVIDQVQHEPAAVPIEDFAEASMEPKKEAVPEAMGLKEYSWSDENDKVTIYVTCEGLPADASKSLITSTFEKSSLVLEIATVPLRRFTLTKLSKEIIPEECKFRLNAAKGKITLTLKKKRTGTWYELVGKL